MRWLFLLFLHWFPLSPINHFISTAVGHQTHPNHPSLPLSACRQMVLLTMTLTSTTTACLTSRHRAASTACTAPTAATLPTTKTPIRRAAPTPTRSWMRLWTMRWACPASLPSRAHPNLSERTRRSSRTQPGTRATSMLYRNQSRLTASTRPGLRWQRLSRYGIRVPLCVCVCWLLCLFQWGFCKF